MWRGAVGAVGEIMKVLKPCAIGVHLEDHTIAARAAFFGCPIQGAARQNQADLGTESVAVGKKLRGGIGFARAKTMQGGEGAVGVAGEHRAHAIRAAIIDRPIQDVAGQKQRAIRISSIAVGSIEERAGGGAETVKIREPSAGGAESEQRAIAPSAARIRHSEQCAARFNQTGLQSEPSPPLKVCKVVKVCAPIWRSTIKHSPKVSVDRMNCFAGRIMFVFMIFSFF